MSPILETARSKSIPYQLEQEITEILELRRSSKICCMKAAFMSRSKYDKENVLRNLAAISHLLLPLPGGSLASVVEITLQKNKVSKLA